MAEGQTDIVGMVRALIADPRAVVKSFTGHNASVIPCIGGNECHYGRTVACAANPGAGREVEMVLVPAAEPRRILVVGGGPAGLECAAAAAERGHRVVLVDRRIALGGMLIPVAEASRQAEIGKYIDHMRRRIAGLNIELRLGVEADAGLVEKIAPEAIVIATGAAYRGGIAGDGPGRVVDAAQALADPAALGAHVVIDGGLDDHLPPLVLADYFVRLGRRVTLLTANLSPGQALEVASLVMLTKRLLDYDVDIRPTTAAVALRGTELAIRNSLTNKSGRIAGVDSVITLGPRVPDGGLASMLKPLRIPTHVIGDALSPRRMVHATLDGARLGRTLV